MINKLNKFTGFVNSLYPHEADYLLIIQKFDTSDNLKILNLINYNCKKTAIAIPYDSTIDKRKYSYLKNWIVKNLSAANVDLFYDWLTVMEKQVMMDAIIPDEEKSILNKAKLIDQTHYYFLKFYELMQKYRDYLLIRMRTQYYQPVSDYLSTYENDYHNAYQLNSKLNNATVDIIKQHDDTNTQTEQWEDLLKTTFYDDEIDGYTRYRAAVRLTFLYYNYRDFAKLRDIYENLDRMFKTGLFYSKRILANYYANRAMMHSKLNELEDAEKYGYLSIRQKNSDYLFYLLNLCSVLLKADKNQEAYCLMTQSIPELKKTASFYYKIGFAAFYIRTLLATQKYEKAVSYAETFLGAYKNEIFKHRWHLFFCAFVQALYKNESYSRLLSVIRRYNLVNREKKFIGEAKYLPVILWHNSAAKFIEGGMSEERLIDTIIQSGTNLINSQYKNMKIKGLVNELSPALPRVFKKISVSLNI